MMATYRSCVGCVLLCVVYSVHSAKMTCDTADGKVLCEMEVTEYVNGDKFRAIFLLTLMDGKHHLPTLTLANFKRVVTLNIFNISLEHVPVFQNTSIRTIHIARNKIKSVPANAFNGPRPSVIELIKNEIQTMADGAINKDVNTLTLRCNQLSIFTQAWFQEPSSVHTLDLAGNRLEYIQDQAFNQMTQLTDLGLSYNRIARIGSEAFSSSISFLYLQFNNITQLTTDMFSHRDERMLSLLLHYNQLSSLPEALLLKLKLAYVQLDGNPWQCQCLRDIERWIREQNITRRYLSFRSDEPVCVVPRSFEDVCVPAANKELQETYAKGLSPVQGCLATPCYPCSELNL